MIFKWVSAFAVVSTLLLPTTGCPSLDGTQETSERNEPPPPPDEVAVAAWPRAGRREGYPLDSRPRDVGRSAPLQCSKQGLVKYRGKHLKYSAEVLAHPAFVARLGRFEQVVRDVALDVYGRAPRAIVHLGAYSCRSSSGTAGRISEHSLGNAIDVAGFAFSPAQAGASSSGLPDELLGAFQVTVEGHWSATRWFSGDAIHRRFLRRLADQLERRDDVFRSMIGPSQRDHENHFHFGMPPWRHVRF